MVAASAASGTAVKEETVTVSTATNPLKPLKMRRTETGAPWKIMLAGDLTPPAGLGAGLDSSLQGKLHHALVGLCVTPLTLPGAQRL